ncbi:hypothetical protein DL769_000151 [Monosporascus sp. CRB-8-3]|nr:hypothetical protein DL769_000151 [Monosporascus sp. CRB-8-3]
MEPDSKPLIDSNPELHSYYLSLESRIGYAYLLGGARHFGYWEHDTYWPFPFSRALRAMEDKVAESLALPAGARLLDAGCGGGNQALYLAKSHGYRILGIDIVDYHVAEAKCNISKANLPAGQVEARKMDYHHLESLDAESFDGIYTLQTLIHASDVAAVLKGFHRLLAPGGRVALFEHNHDFVKDSVEVLANSMGKTNDVASPPAINRPQPIVLKSMLEDAGFTDVVIRDYTANIKPMMRFFYMVAYVPWVVVSFLGLERYFVNLVAVVAAYRHHDLWRYIAISATKPGGSIEGTKSR